MDGVSLQSRRIGTSESSIADRYHCTVTLALTLLSWLSTSIVHLARATTDAMHPLALST